MINKISDQIYSPSLLRRIFASGAIGNILETYDLFLISIMASVLSNAFFPPSDNPYNYMINILYVYFIGLLVRPIGNIIMGTIADKIGRKKLMIYSLIFTGGGTFCIGLIPNYSDIGIWATILFVLLRICVNFFAGIEYVNSATYLIESSKPESRGFYGSWTAIGICGGYLLASCVALVITKLIQSHFLPEWSWRIIFLFSSVGILFGYWLRRSIPESLEFILNKTCSGQAQKKHILKDAFAYVKNHVSQCLSLMAITTLGAFLSYIYYLYIPINLVISNRLSQLEACELNVISLTLIVILIPIFGKLSDYFNRMNMLKGVCFCSVLLAFPFFFITSSGSFNEILFATLLISIPSACFFSLYPVIITESFPSRIRCTTASLIYQVIVSLEMLSLPIGINYLLKTTHSSYSISYLMIVICIVTFVGIIFLNRSLSDSNVSVLPSTSL